MSDDAVVQQLPRPPWRLRAEFVRGQRRRSLAFCVLAVVAGSYAQERLRDLAAIAADEAVHADATRGLRITCRPRLPRK